MFLNKLLFLMFGAITCLEQETPVEVLTRNFFKNLEGDPKLMVDHGLSEESKGFIDRQVENYVALVAGRENRFGRRKRRSDSLTRDSKGTYLLKGIEPAFTIPASFPEDVALFHHNQQWYAAALESSDITKQANNLTLYSYNNTKFEVITSVSVVNGVRVATISLDDTTTLIVVAENDTCKGGFGEKSGIFEFSNGNLTQIQSIDMHFSNDVALWWSHEDVYMAIAHQLNTLIYKWLGKHFDLVQTIETKAASRVTPFSIGDSKFLAIANFRDASGNSRAYSEIFKYNYDSETYEVYERLLTSGCSDIKFFSFALNEFKKEHFLIVANSYEKDSYGEIDYETDSILYKYVDGYFIPFHSFRLNGVEEWLPVEGPERSVVLFASCRFDGLRSFQYDGWAFVETPQEYTGALKRGIKSLRSYNFNFTSTIVVANKNSHGPVPNMFHLSFEHRHALNDIQDEMMDWCQKTYRRLAELDNGEDLNEIVGKAERADTLVTDLLIEDSIDEIRASIESLNQIVDEIEEDLKNSLQSSNFKAIRNEMTADKIIFNNDTFINNFNVATINGVIVADLLEFNIVNGFAVDELLLEFSKIDGKLVEKTVNGRGANDLMRENGNWNLEELSVEGQISCLVGAKIEGELNGIKVNDQNLLTINGSQKIATPVRLGRATLGSVSSKFLNGQDLSTLEVWEGEKIDVNFIKNLTVGNLIVGGYINDVDVPTLDRYSLKTSGNQTITGRYVFDNLNGGDLGVEGRVSGKNLKDLVRTDGGNFSILHQIAFGQPLEINNLTVLANLNKIAVKDGKLDMLLLDADHTQRITGSKRFDNIEILNPIKLQGKIKSEALEKINPVITIDQDIVLKGDRVISGDVQIENLVMVEDMTTPDGSYSLTKLLTSGLRLNSTEIQPRLRFLQQLNVDQVFVGTINGVDPQNYVVNGENETQFLQGLKVFEGDVTITGDTKVRRINDVDVEELERNVLRTSGDQVVQGKHRVKKVIIDQISSNATKIGTTPWKETITVNTNQNLTATKTIKGDVTSASLKANKITVNGLINGRNFSQIVQDTVTINTDQLVRGHKFFDNLTIDALSVRKGVAIVDIDKILDEETRELRLTGPVKFVEPVSVRKLYFSEKFNGVDSNDFGETEPENALIGGDHNIDRLVIYGGAFVASGEINGVKVTELVENTVKIDETFRFNSATFDTVIAKEPLVLEGQIEDVDLSNIVLSHSDSEQTIFDNITFHDLSINGLLQLDGLVNGLNMTEFCNFALGTSGAPDVTIEGGAYFVKGPDAGALNGFDVNNIRENVWFKDSDVTLQGYGEFDYVKFQNDVNVGSFVDNVSLKLLSENYFSKTKDQEIAATLTFNDLVFEQNVSVSEIVQNEGEVNGIDLQEFIGTALLDDYNQTFETKVYFENVQVEDLQGEFLVNDLNLETDLMRYDKINIVTGSKSFKNLSVENLNVDNNVQVQNVDVLAWVKNSVLKSGTFNVTGIKSFNNVTFTRGLEVAGVVNGLKFDNNNVMVKNLPQEIKSKKTFTTNTDDPLTLKTIKLKGTLNNLDLSDLVNNQAYKDKDNYFKTPINFRNNITTQNLMVKKTFQGVNVTDLINIVTNFGALNNLLENFNNLLEASYRIEGSLKAQACYLHYYKLVQEISGITNSLKVKYGSGEERIATLTQNGSKIDLFAWSEAPYPSQFVLQETIPEQGHITYLDQVLMGRYLYAEGNDGLGRFIHLTDPPTPFLTMPNNKTRSTTSFLLPTTSEACTLFLYENNCRPKIFCENADSIRLFQTLDISRAYQSSSILIVQDLYLVIVTHNGLESSITTWKLNTTTNMFESDQTIFEAQPVGVTTTRYYRHHFLAVASGHLQDAMYSGRVAIWRYDFVTRQFLLWQNLELDAPTQVEFALLPSNELVLYVVTDNPTQPLIVYRYEGVEGFKQKIIASTLGKIRYMNHLSGDLVVAQSYDEISVLQVVFKGENDEIRKGIY